MKRIDLFVTEMLDSINFDYLGIMVKVFANGPGDLSSISGLVIPKTKKMVLDAPFLTISIIR